MEKKMIILLSSLSVFVLIFVLIVSICLLTQKNKNNNNNTNVICEEDSNIEIKEKPNLKKVFYVGDESPNFEEYFEIYENYSLVEMAETYINTNFNSNEAAIYFLSCSYKDVVKSISISVENKIIISVKQDVYKIKKGSVLDIQNIKELFILTINGNESEIKNEMFFHNIDVNLVGTYSAFCACYSEQKSIIVNVIEDDGANTQLIKDLNYNYQKKDDLYFGILKALEYESGTLINLNQFVKVYSEEEEIVNYIVTFSTNLDSTKAGKYPVNATFHILDNDYSIEFEIKITEISNEPLSNSDIENLYSIYIEDSTNMYSSRYVEYANETNTYYYKDLNNNDFQIYMPLGINSKIIFYYDSEKEDDIITLAYLLKYYFETSSLTGEKIFVVDINKNILDYKTKYEITNNTLDLEYKELFVRIKTTDYYTKKGLEKPNELNVYGPYYSLVYNHSIEKTEEKFLEKADKYTTYETYSNYLKTYLAV